MNPYNSSFFGSSSFENNFTNDVPSGDSWPVGNDSSFFGSSSFGNDFTNDVPSGDSWPVGNDSSLFGSSSFGNDFTNDVPSGDSWSVGNNFTNDFPNEESIPNVERDYTAEFTTDQIFESRDAMLDWARRVGNENGFVIVIDKSCSKIGNKMPRCTLICGKGGLYKPPREGHTMSRDTGTYKCGCPFKLRGVAQPPDGVKWGLKAVNGFHNHKAAESLEGFEYPSRLTATQKQLVRDMSNSTAPREILSVMKQQDPSITTGIRSIYNVKALYKKEQLGGLSEAGYVLRELNVKNYMYDFVKNNHTGEITDILWVHPKSLELYVNFPSVLIIDATYKINEYGIPLLEIVGITSTMQTYSIMFAYLSNETTERFVWVLDTLKRWMVLKGVAFPSVVVSDRDLALLGAIGECFPFAHHILCIWHINQCVMKKCRPMLGKRWIEFNNAWHSIIHSQSVDTLDFRWNAMLNNFSNFANATTYLWNTWLYPYKERFVDMYVDKVMHLGSHSSQRVESAHARLKRYFGDTSASLSTSFQKIEKMLTAQFGDIQSSFQKSLSIPRHRHVREAIYSEIRYCVSLEAMDLIDKQIKVADKHCISEEDLCNCKIKLTHGLPCAHDIAMFRLAGVPIPQNYIHIHWRTLSMRAPERTDEGVQPDKASQLMERLNEMEPASRDSMIDRFFDMADPSRCTVRPPAYNTEQKGRPTRRDEQNNGRKPFFSIPTSEKKVPHIPNSQASKTKDPLIYAFPKRYRRYISHCVDVIGDGHCGFRAIAAQLHGSEHEWPQVRYMLIQEIKKNMDLYENLSQEINYASRLLSKLNCFAVPAPAYYWMDVIPLGVVVASAYNVVLHTFDLQATHCHTHLPLRSPLVPFSQRQHIAIGHVEGIHFVQLFLYPEYPVPPITVWRFSGESNPSDEWARDYQARIQLWYDVMGIELPGQNFEFMRGFDD